MGSLVPMQEEFGSVIQLLGAGSHSFSDVLGIEKYRWK